MRGACARACNGIYLAKNSWLKSVRCITIFYDSMWVKRKFIFKARSLSRAVLISFPLLFILHYILSRRETKHRGEFIPLGSLMKFGDIKEYREETKKERLSSYQFRPSTLPFSHMQ